MARWSDEFRAHAVVLLQVEGYPDKKGAITRISNQLKVPVTTLRRWFEGQSNPPPAEIVSIKKEQIIELLRGEIYNALKEMPKAIWDADYKELATSMAIMVDKLQLLEGEPTARTEIIHELSDDQRANRITELLDAARTRRDGHASEGEFLQ